MIPLARLVASHHPHVLALYLAASGCAQTTALTQSDGGDAATPDVTTPDVTTPDAGAFCANPSSSRIALNGVVAESPSARAQELALNCCEAAYVTLITARFTDAISVMWRHQVGQGPDLPVTLDLARLPAGWTVSVMDGCAPATPGCTPIDRYDAGLTGTLHVERVSGQLRMSVCLDASEPASEPHPRVHSLQLWVPPITAGL